MLSLYHEDAGQSSWGGMYECVYTVKKKLEKIFIAVPFAIFLHLKLQLVKHSTVRLNFRVVNFLNGTGAGASLPVDMKSINPYTVIDFEMLFSLYSSAKQLYLDSLHQSLYIYSASSLIFS